MKPKMNHREYCAASSALFAGVYSLVLAGGMFPAALKKIGTLTNRSQLFGYRR